MHTKNSAFHNHPPTDDPRVHAAHLLRDAEKLKANFAGNMRSLKAAQSSAGVWVMRIEVVLNNPDSLLTSKDIVNSRSVLRARELSTSTVTEVVFQRLRNGRFFKGISSIIIPISLNFSSGLTLGRQLCSSCTQMFLSLTGRTRPIAPIIRF